jgi:hypothetical protein
MKIIVTLEDSINEFDIDDYIKILEKKPFILKVEKESCGKRCNKIQFDDLFSKDFNEKINDLICVTKKLERFSIIIKNVEDLVKNISIPTITDKR